MVLDNRCVEALSRLESLETTAAFKNGSLARSMLNIQKGRCHIKMGNFDVGEAAIEQGLPGLRKAGSQFNGDVADALLSLGDAELSRWDYAAAKAHYLEAKAIPDALDPMVIAPRLIKVTAFDGGDEPLNYAAEAIRLAETRPGTSKEQLAAYHTLHARILLNQGQNQAAFDELKQALALTGGLDLTVSLADIALRSDLAVAAQLSGNDDAARKYLAYTGAGRTEKDRFPKAMNMDPPVCGSQSGLQPDDMAIVSFAIAGDGHVSGASTIYSRGSAEVAGAFARAVSNWLWDPEAIKGIPPYILNGVHVELRCTQVASSVPDIFSPLRDRFLKWAGGVLALDSPDTLLTRPGRSAMISRLRAMAAADENAPPSLRTVAISGLMAIMESVSALKQDGHFEKALKIGRANQAPQDVINWMEFEQLNNRALFGRWTQGMPKAKLADVFALTQKPAISGDALVADTIKIFVAKPYDTRMRPVEWLDLLKQVAADDRLAAHHPLRQHANLLLANEAAKNKDFEAARRYFDATGLTEEQCALIGARPAMRSSGLDFPGTAMQYGFEGWVSVEYDIRNDGRTASLRPIVAYPPFIFNKAASGGLADSRFEASYRPTGGNACSANRSSIIFVFPH